MVGGQWVISGTAWDEVVSGIWVFVTVAFCSPVLTVNALKGWVGDNHYVTSTKPSPAPICPSLVRETQASQMALQKTKEALKPRPQSS